MPSATKTRTSRAENPVEEVDEDDEFVDVRPRRRPTSRSNIVDMELDGHRGGDGRSRRARGPRRRRRRRGRRRSRARPPPHHRDHARLALTKDHDRRGGTSRYPGRVLGAAYEVVVLPVHPPQLFNRAVYAYGHVAGRVTLSVTAVRTISAIDFYAILADVFGAIAFFGANVACAIAAVIVTVRIIKVFTGMNETRPTSSAYRSRGDTPRGSWRTSPPTSSARPRWGGTSATARVWGSPCGGGDDGDGRARHHPRAVPRAVLQRVRG